MNNQAEIIFIQNWRYHYQILLQNDRKYIVFDIPFDFACLE